MALERSIEEGLGQESSTTANCFNRLRVKTFEAINYCTDKVLPADDANHQEPSGILDRLVKASVTSVLPTGLAFGYAGAASHFLSPETAWYNNPYFLAAVYTVINFSLNMVSSSNSMSRRLARAGRALAYSSVDIFLKDTLIHEGGHALPAQGLFKDANPKIEITPTYFLNYAAKTTYENYHGLTDAGAKIGQKKCETVVAAMGSGSVLIENFLYLIAAEAIPDKYPEIKAYLRFCVCFSIFANVYYALTGFGDCKDQSNDFCQLKAANISPALLILLIVGSNLILQLALSLTSKLISKTCRKEEVEEYQSLDEPKVSEIIDFGDEESPLKSENNSESKRFGCC